jgi:hypothetical protein
MIHRSVIPQNTARRSTSFRERSPSWQEPFREHRATSPVSAPTTQVTSVALIVILAVVLDWFSTLLNWLGAELTLSGEKGLFQMNYEEPTLARAMRLLALLLFVGAGLLSALQPRRARLPRLAAFLLYPMLACCTLWTLIGYEPSDYIEHLLSTWHPLVFVMCLGIFAGLDRSLWKLAHPLSLGLAYGSMALGCYYTARYSTMGQFSGVNPMVEYLQLTFWLSLGAVALNSSTRSWLYLAPLLPLASCIPMAMMIGSRSFALLCAAGLAAGLFYALQRFIRSSRRSLIVVLVCTSLVGAGFIWALAVAAPENLDALQHHLFEDTRSSQYRDFFEQVSLLRLVPGLGPNASYIYGDRGNYGHIDNQFIFIAFKLGLPVLLGYGALVLWPGLTLLFTARNQSQRRIGVLFAFWTLATLGLSIFHAVAPNPENFLIILLAGRAIDLKQTQRELDAGLVESPSTMGTRALRPTGLQVT